MKTCTCIIVDDEEIDRLMVTSFAKRFSYLTIIGVCSSAGQALQLLESNNVDILFLDIDMQGLNGLELRRRALNVPVCIYISSYPEYALESFELDTLDFIVKPVKFDRFAQAMARVEKYMELREKVTLFDATMGGDVIFIKDGHQQIKVKLHEILYLEALKDYTRIVTQQRNTYVLSSIGNLLKEASFKNFIRVHRSYAVQKHFIDKISHNKVVLYNDFSIPVGRMYKDNLNNIV